MQEGIAFAGILAGRVSGIGLSVLGGLVNTKKFSMLEMRGHLLFSNIMVYFSDRYYAKGESLSRWDHFQAQKMHYRGSC